MQPFVIKRTAACAAPTSRTRAKARKWRHEPSAGESLPRMARAPALPTKPTMFPGQALVRQALAMKLMATVV